MASTQLKKYARQIGSFPQDRVIMKKMLLGALLFFHWLNHPRTFGPKNSHGKMHFVFLCFLYITPLQDEGNLWVPHGYSRNPRKTRNISRNSPHLNPYILFISHLFCGFRSHQIFSKFSSSIQGTRPLLVITRGP